MAGKALSCCRQQKSPTHGAVSADDPSAHPAVVTRRFALEQRCKLAFDLPPALSDAAYLSLTVLLPLPLGTFSPG
eukprot:767095-Hanusia_phi.AAC.1